MDKVEERAALRCGDIESRGIVRGEADCGDDVKYDGSDTSVHESYASSSNSGLICTHCFANTGPSRCICAQYESDIVNS